MENSSAGEFKLIEEPEKPLAMEPRKFSMWLFMGSVIMLFAALTSAYIVREAEGNWVYFEMPPVFTISTIVILLSSVTMQWAYWSARKDNLGNLKLLLTITAVLGFAFLVLQWEGWTQLVAAKIYFVGNPSGSFLYVLTGVHALHIISAIVFLLIVVVAAYRLQVHAKKLVQLEMCTTYWHFLGGLWLYLFVFLLLYR
ncbi:MAG: cytochrome c oxidase subunit 3 [Cyclobacteriaceae bacterium]|nr:cytochrome c oxidase subunit 3 [Cytophagales bacterium]MBX2898628.1 cytochrome c oxidase subunit 3 [Cyclobacteriaceae bacterium]